MSTTVGEQGLCPKCKGMCKDTIECQQSQIDFLQQRIELKDARIDWTVDDNAKKAIQISDLQQRNRELEEALRTIDDCLGYSSVHDIPTYNAERIEELNLPDLLSNHSGGSKNE